jgi:DNA-binding transcriptional regulator PaaX
MPSPPDRRYNLSPQQLDALVVYWKYRWRTAGRTGKAPTMSELRLELGGTSRRTAYQVVESLVARGHLERIAEDKARNYRLTTKGYKRARDKIWRDRRKRGE